MSESAKTISLIAVTAAVLVLAYATRPAPVTTATDAIVGKSLFPDLDDPLKAKRMRIVTFDEGTSRVREFEVAQVNGVWSLPSHKNYPADAKEQMASAAAALVDLKVLQPVTKDRTMHEVYGVVEPKPAEDQFGQTGIGKLVVVEDDAGKALARIIIGKQDKSARKDDFNDSQSELRFVRKPNEEQVYRVQMKADKFSTKFNDWIETDLLKLNAWDVAEVKLRDYSVTDYVTPQGQYRPELVQRADLDLVYDDKDAKWTVRKLVEYDGDKQKEVKLTAEQELNATKLNDLKSALGNLKIIDVARKPAQMSANLKADKDFLGDVEARRDLMKRGYLPVPVADNQVDIVSSDGEAIVRMKDGVEYVLRFGSVAGIDTEEDKKKDESAKGDGESSKTEKTSSDAAEPKEKSGGLSRYIMVKAQLNSDLIPKPELKPLPELKKAPEKTATDKKGADAKSADAKSADKKGAAAKGDAKADAKKDTSKPADAKSTVAKSDESASEDDQEALEAERDKIEKENKRKQDEYDEKVKKAYSHVKDLNARFADWYYVVGDETYRKIHLGQSDIIKKKSTKEDTAGAAGPKNPFNLNALPGAQPN